MSNGKSYDYVIVGAGSAGCTLANRLTEDPDIQVLVIEAGAASEAPSSVFPWAGEKSCSNVFSTGAISRKKKPNSTTERSNAPEAR